MERQYIGARYVPKFFENPNTNDSAWLQGVAYEALTIVTLAGNSYTSKKPVPASIGSPNLNPEYWVSTGIYNEQVEAIRQALQDAVSDISDLQLETGDLDARVTSLTTKIGDTNKNIAGIEKRIICIGDSYNYDNAGWIGWGTSFKNRYPWIDVYVNSNPGGGFVTVANERTFTTELDEIYSSITDPEGITDVVVMGGYNDMSMSQSRADIQTGMSRFKNKSNELFPNAKIHVGYIGTDARLNGKQTDNFTYANYYAYCCAVNGLVFIPNIQYTLLVKDFIFFDESNPNSGFHPNTSGSGELARHLMTHLQGGIPDIRYEYNVGTSTIGLHNDKCYITGNAGANPPQFLPPAQVIANGVWVKKNGSAYNDHIWWGKPENATSGGWAGCGLFWKTDGTVELFNIKYYNGDFYYSQNTKASIDGTGFYGNISFMTETKQMY